jgi:hypothetical protein
MRYALISVDMGDSMLWQMDDLMQEQLDATNTEIRRPYFCSYERGEKN